MKDRAAPMRHSPMTDNLYNAIHLPDQSSSHPVAIETEGGEQITYAEFHAWTGRYAAWVQSRGVRAGERVLVQADKSAQLLMLCYAVMRAGAVFVPINVGARRAEVSSVLADCEPSLVICDPRRKAMFESLTAELGAPASIETLTASGRGTAVEQAEATTPSAGSSVVPADAPAALMYTSGTTGRPKAAIITHGNILSNGEALREHWRWSARDVPLHTLPLYHLHGLFVATMPSLLSGSKILLYRRFIARQAVAALPRASVFMGVPTYFARMLAVPALTQRQCATVRMFIAGSAPLREQTFQAFRQRTGKDILCRYGLTETGGVACNRPDEPPRLGAVGIPLPGFSVRVGDEGESQSGSGEVGEMQVRGASVCPGYWRRPQESAMAFTSDGYFRTGDLGRILPDGSLEIVGRAKDVIITGGANVNPLEVESALDACPGVAESAVVGVPDPEYGEAVVAFVVPQKQNESLEVNANYFNEIFAKLKRELAIYKVPRQIIVRTELPRNSMGKILKNLLRDAPELQALRELAEQPED
jgi:malonyl-CoA/methylmalonyl-CoA synthetase